MGASLKQPARSLKQPCLVAEAQVRPRWVDVPFWANLPDKGQTSVKRKKRRIGKKKSWGTVRDCATNSRNGRKQEQKITLSCLVSLAGNGNGGMPGRCACLCLLALLTEKAERGLASLLLLASPANHEPRIAGRGTAAGLGEVFTLWFLAGLGEGD